MRSILLVASLLTVGSPSWAGEVRVVVEPSAGTVADNSRTGPMVAVRPMPRADKTADTSYKVWVPFFVVDTTDPEGVNTLFSVRNRGTSTISLTYTYHSPRGESSQAVIISGTLAPRETRTVSVREVEGLPTDSETGLKTGYIEIEEDSMSGELSGDWFLVDPANNFASGDRLVDFDSFCLYWDSRFFNGGPFSGGTTFTFLLGSNLTSGTSPIVVGQVYDEPGNHRGTVQVYTADLAFQVNTAELPSHVLGPFGVIEWTIQNPYNGFVMSTFRALGKYSAGLPSMCVDSAIPAS